MAKQLHGLETGTAQMAENIKLQGLKKKHSHSGRENDILHGPKKAQL